MSPKLPEPIAAYFAAANKHDIEAALASFAEGAVVEDESQTHDGIDAIRTWMQESTRKYGDIAVEVTDVMEADGKTDVSSVVSGSFKGSPARLRYRFTLGGSKVSHLEIH